MRTIARAIKDIAKMIRAMIHSFIVFFNSCFSVFLSIKKCKRLLKQGERILQATQPLESIRPDFGTLPVFIEFSNPEPSIDLSIIIPLYNSADYIEECLDSIFNQNTKYSYEIILINDGSTDNTIEIIGKYIKDSRIRLIDQDNHGQAYARNRAIEQSLGKFIMMVDSDDTITDDCVEALLSTAINTNSDIAEGHYKRFSKKEYLEEMYNDKGRITLFEYSKNKRFVLSSTGYSWAKVYRRCLWETLRYPEGYIFEDVITKFILRRKAKQVAVIDKTIYGYRHDPNSSSHKLDGMKHLDSIWVYPRIVSLCKSEEVPFDDVFYLLSLNHIAILNYITTLHIPPDVRCSCFAEMQKQLRSIQFCRPKKLPYLFYLLEQSIIKGNIDAWQEIAGTVTKYKLLKKWREIN